MNKIVVGLDADAAGSPAKPVQCPMKQLELITKMRARVERCRRLARMSNDERISEELLAMADEGEADIARLLLEEPK